MHDRESWLADTLVGLADTGADGFDASTYANQVTDHLTQLLPDSQVGLLLAEDTASPRVAAASSDGMRRVMIAELAQGKGPYLDCYRTGQRVLNQRVDQANARWPRFAMAATAAGFDYASALPIGRHGVLVGAVGVGHRQSLAGPESGLASAVVEAASVGLMAQRALFRARRMSEQLQQALITRVAIEQAKGMVAAALGITVDAAFELLRTHARKDRRRLVDVANDTINRVLLPEDLRSGRRSVHRHA